MRQLLAPLAALALVVAAGLRLRSLRGPADRHPPRLKRSFDTSGFPRQARVVLTALKRYGMILADNGSPLFISGAPNRSWDNDHLHTLQRVRGSDFEVVDTTRLPRR